MNVESALADSDVRQFGESRSNQYYVLRVSLSALAGAGLQMP